MKVTTRAHEIDAVQWDGTEASLIEIQQMLRTINGSPYRNPGNADKLGVPVTNGANAYGLHALEHIDIGCWVTKDGAGTVRIYTNDAFGKLHAQFVHERA